MQDVLFLSPCNIYCVRKRPCPTPVIGDHGADHMSIIAVVFIFEIRLDYNLPQVLVRVLVDATDIFMLRVGS